MTDVQSAGMPSDQTLLITAVVPEARALARAFHLGEVRGGLPMWRNERITLVCVGVRARRIGELLGQLRGAGWTIPPLIVMAGVAGGLSSDLKVGDVVVDVREPGDGFPALAGVRRGELHTSSAVASTAPAKRELFAKTGCLAVDMETSVVRAFAQAHRATFVAVRGISDTADQALDVRLLSLVDESGNVRVGRAIGMLAARPWMLGQMLRLGRGTKRAMEGVARTVEAIIASGWPAGAANRH